MAKNDTDRTKREWTVERYRPTNGQPYEVRADTLTVALVLIGIDPDETEERRVADLIAAAPKMLKALRDIAAGTRTANAGGPISRGNLGYRTRSQISEIASEALKVAVGND